MKTIIIAEVGVNHNGKINLAKKMIRKAAEAGADFIKFQTYQTDALVTKNAKKANYQKFFLTEDENQYNMLKKYELNFSQFIILKKECIKNKIRFLSSSFDIKSAKFLKKIGTSIFKIPSGEITNLPYLRYVGSQKKKVILSTGMSTLKEISDAIKILISKGTKKKDITVLQCNTEYPTPYKDINLFGMLSIKKKFNINIGLSDHSSGIEVPIAAVALGAKVIEKHFTLDKNSLGPDHKASIDFLELKKMIVSIKNIEKSLGDGVKKITKSEKKNIKSARKSLVAKIKIKKGEKFTYKNIAIKRPGNGISPMKIDFIIGKKARKNFKKDELIKK